MNEIEIEIKDKKKTIVGISIGIVSLLIMIIGATYAYWNAKEVVNFNTATISYETEDKALIVLNGTTGLLTLGTIIGDDMVRMSNDVIYYAGEVDKTTVPTEVTIGVATYDNINDRNVYSCDFSLALTHNGTADIIDKFLSNNYSNRSEGQIILTVNGEEYDLNDGFPSTITGSINVDTYNPGKIAVGLKFYNLTDVDQQYLVDSNGYININVTSFTCSVAGEVTTTKYWSFLKDDAYLFHGTGYDSANSHIAKKFDNYQDLVNVTLYGITAPNMPQDIDYLIFYTKDFIYDDDSKFKTSTECENFIDWYADYFDIDSNTLNCEYNSHGYYDSNLQTYIGVYYPKIDDSNLRSEQVSTLFNSLENCQSFLSIIINTGYFTTKTDEYGYDDQTIYDMNNFTCSAITINNPFFFRETTPPVVSDADKWEIFYTHGAYDTEAECEAWANHSSTYKNGNIVLYHRGEEDPNDKSYCIYYNGYYYLQSQAYANDYLVDYDISDLVDSSTLVHNYNNSLDRLLFNSEAGCLSVVNDMDDTFYRSYPETYLPSVKECIQTRTAGEVYYDIKLDACLYKDNELTCIDINEDSFIENFSDNTDYLNNRGFTCEYYVTPQQANTSEYENISCNYSTNSYDNFRFKNQSWGIRSFAYFNTSNYSCDWNREYFGSMEQVCGLIYGGGTLSWDG